ncbi:hypothetical protein [Actinomadura rayongensis]|uniref:Uncharacterized protein n=1 Tax=Actinomadura rayongensis TaxID=1429076 RepID=A0A6I4WDM3_9ACTN|nr:hypothetical protein [Actinomadura rayongensis]MXQ68347.1 hypothetical protein [Actinomadura rayongensis]
MGLLRRRSRQTLTNQTESISGFYSGVKKADADSAAPMIQHHERAEYLAALQQKISAHPGVQSAFTHVNTYPVLHVFTVGNQKRAVRVIVTYRDGDWWLSWDQVGIRARETAEAARLLAETMARTLPDAPPNLPGSA